MSDMSVVRELHDWMGEQVREPQFEVPVVKIPADALAQPTAPGLRLVAGPWQCTRRSGSPARSHCPGVF